jgi:3-oxoadipate enol-lactonase
VAWLEVNDISFRYVVEGGPGPAVVLLHEMGGTLDSWDGVAPELASAGYRVLRYDQRGAGLSEKTRGPITSQMLTDDLAAIIAAVGPEGPWHFVAIAAATIQVLMFAAQRRTDVASQTFCNPLAGVAPARVAQLEERARLAEEEGIRASLPLTLGRSYPAALGDPATYQRYRGRYLANDPVCFASAHRALAATDVSALVPDVLSPTMVVAGRLDQVRPVTASAEFAASIPGARFEIIEAGHMLAAQAPDLLSALLRDFISQVTGDPVSAAGARAGGLA